MGGEGDRTRYCEAGKILGCIIANDIDDFSIILKLPQIKVSPNQKIIRDSASLVVTSNWASKASRSVVSEV